MSTWEFSSEAFNYDATPLVQLGISVILHTKKTIILSWDFCGKYGWSVGVTLKHYQCQRVIPNCTRKMLISYTTEFRQHHLTQPSVTPYDMMIHRMNHLTSALQGTTSSNSDGQMTNIQKLQDALNNWVGDMTLTNQEPAQRQAPPSTKDKLYKRRSTRVQPPAPRVKMPGPMVHIPE